MVMVVMVVVLGPTGTLNIALVVVEQPGAASQDTGSPGVSSVPTLTEKTLKLRGVRKYQDVLASRSCSFPGIIRSDINPFSFTIVGH